MTTISKILNASISHIAARIAGLVPCVGLIFVIARVWSTIVTETLFSGDALAFYYLLSSGQWKVVYKTEPVLFLVMSILRPSSFQWYIFSSMAFLLGSLLIVLSINHYHIIDRIIILMFCSCSFYGMHFILNFQRQFLALILFIFAISLRRFKLLFRILSLFSQRFSILLQAFWELRRLKPVAAFMLVIVVAPIALMLLIHLEGDTADNYVSYGQTNFSHLAIFFLMNVALVGIIILTSVKDNKLNTLGISYIACSALALAWPQFGGAFQRVVYYCIPLFVILWPKHMLPSKVAECRSIIILYTIVTGYMWIRMNFAWIILGIGDRW